MNTQPKTKKLNVLVLSHISDITGGAELSMLNVFDELSKRYDVNPSFILRTPLKGMVGALSERKWTYYPLDYTFWSESNPSTESVEVLRRAKINNKAIRDIENIIKSTKPDIVMTNSIVCPWAAVASYLQGVPHIWFVREYGDLDHGRTFMLGREETFEDIDHLSNLVVANSTTLASHLTKYMDGAKVTTLYTPFDIPKLVEQSKAPIKNPFNYRESLKTVITSGSIVESKGQLEIVRAVGELNKRGLTAEVCLVGRTDNLDYLNKISDVVKEFDIEDKVHFVGFHSNPLPYMAAADVGIMTSRMEAFGRVTFEYLALGMPIVGVNSGATPEMVKDGVNGFLFDISSSLALTKKLSNYAKDPSLLVKHGVESKRIAQDMMKNMNNVDAFYKKVETVLEASKTTKPSPPPRSLIHHWLNYPALALEAKDFQGPSIKAQVRSKAKDKLRPAYHKLRSLKAKVTGK